MWVLQGGNVAKNNSMMGVLHSLPKEAMKILGM